MEFITAFIGSLATLAIVLGLGYDFGSKDAEPATSFGDHISVVQDVPAE